MMRPWMKFYTGDWRSDPALRVCSLAARGLWMEMLCIMHEAAPRGSLLINDQPVSGKQLAMLVGMPLKDVAYLLGELAAAGVFSREGDSTIYSRRMRRDTERSEEGREHISKRYPNRSPSRSPSRSDEEKTTAEPTTQKLEARIPEPERSSSLRSEESRARTSAFDEFWVVYPHKVGKADARKAFERIAKAGAVTFEILMAALRAYTEKNDDRPWCNPATWLNGGRWDDQPASVSRNQPRFKKGFADLALELQEREDHERDRQDFNEIPLVGADH